MKNTKKRAIADIIYTFIIIFMVCCLASTCNAQYKIQNFELNERTGNWQAVGSVYISPDTLSTIHRYKWKGEQIIAMQDYKKVKNKWIKYGSEYSPPDTLRFIHAIVK